MGEDPIQKIEDEVEKVEDEVVAEVERLDAAADAAYPGLEKITAPAEAAARSALAHLENFQSAMFDAGESSFRHAEELAKELLLKAEEILEQVREKI